jgi:catechol 2,3-dioxygenase-like lactoylglutathione lyase family enzyme
MINRLTHVTVFVEDQDEALSWYVKRLGFEKRVDETFGEAMRWLTVSPPGQKDLEIVLFKAQTEEHHELIGMGTMWVLETDDCSKDYLSLTEKGVEFAGPPNQMPWGLSAIFKDLYGNPYNLLQPLV